ncbi:hypothetical protein HY68_26400 [Streptomyces sp. AcH 505]|nr:hypothetical protein HY68_26400 [Streptomyces sp. AcH 505]
MTAGRPKRCWCGPTATTRGPGRRKSRRWQPASPPGWADRPVPSGVSAGPAGPNGPGAVTTDCSGAARTVRSVPSARWQR